jgi:hypothetical protein
VIAEYFPFQKQNKRGVNAANPNSGRLAAQLEASRTAPIAPEPSRREDTLIVSAPLHFWGSFFILFSLLTEEGLQDDWRN